MILSVPDEDTFRKRVVRSRFDIYVFIVDGFHTVKLHREAIAQFKRRETVSLIIYYFSVYH